MIAHISEDGCNRIQTVVEHTEGVYELCAKKAQKIHIANIARLCAIFHDIGKEKQRFQDYLLADEIQQKSLKGKIEHSSAGAKYIYDHYHGSTELVCKLLAELVSYAIAAHHGMFDKVNEEGELYWKKRLERAQDYDEVCENAKRDIFVHYDIDKILEGAKDELDFWLGRFVVLSGHNKEEMYFYFSCLQRLLLSVLIDADWEDTANFMTNKQEDEKGAEVVNIFEKAAKNFDQYMVDLKEKFKEEPRGEQEREIYRIRNAIQKECSEFAGCSAGIYCLSIPTGGGKTLSGLAYALTYAKQHPETERIVYVAPYISVIEQNVDIIKDAVGNANWVLEHHSNVIAEGEHQDEESNMWMDINWDEPFVCTTFVQFMNTLFSDKKQAIRRMHRLANAVIIIDEVQAMPIKCIYTFNSMINFLNEVCGANVVLCTATQPQLDNARLEHRIRYSEPTEMVGNIETRFKQFDRVDIVSPQHKGAVSFEELAEHILTNLQRYQSILAVLNTKSAVKYLYECLLEHVSDELEFYYLTTNLCAEHRSDVIRDIKQLCKRKDRKCIVVSTNLIEAGVDISFECVYRSMAGLDSIAQSAGRCNRNGELDRGVLYMVDVADENKGKMKELLSAINATEHVLYNRGNTKDLLAPSVMTEYYNFFYLTQEQREQMKFPIKRFDTDIYRLLYAGFESEDKTIVDYINNAAYKTVGREYQVIDQNMVGVIVPYKKGREVIHNMQQVNSYQEMQKWIRIAQRYTVNIPYYRLKQYMDQGIIYCCSDKFPEIYFASLGGYHSKMGFTGEIEDMIF